MVRTRAQSTLWYVIKWVYASSQACCSATLVYRFSPLTSGTVILWERSVHKGWMQLCLKNYVTEHKSVRGCRGRVSRRASYMLWQSKVCQILTNRVVYIRRGIRRTWHHQDRWPSFFHTLPLISLIEPMQAGWRDVEDIFIYILDQDR